MRAILRLTVDTKAGPVWTGEVRLNEAWLTQPLRWRRPRRIFVCAHADLFHPDVPDEWIDRVFAIMALAPQHTFQVLTKRAARMREYVLSRNEVRPDCPITNAAFWSVAKPRGYKGNGGLCARPLPNVWLGVSVEDKARADERIPDLLATPAAMRFISAEPLLGPVDLRRIRYEPHNPNPAPGPANPPQCLNALTGQTGSYAVGRWYRALTTFPGLDWVIAGGENGPRPMHPDWARSLRDQCAAAGVPFLFKQWGEWAAPSPDCVPSASTTRPTAISRRCRPEPARSSVTAARTVKSPSRTGA